MLFKINRKALPLLTALVIACAFALFACSDQTQPQQEPQEPQNRTIADSAGRRVELPPEVTKVAVAGPIAQEMMLTLAPDTLVGLEEKLSATQAKYIGDYSKLPVYGQLYGGEDIFNQETLKAAGPQVIIDICAPTETIKADMDALQEQTGIPVFHIDAQLSSFADAYSKLGEVLDKQERANELASYCSSTYRVAMSALWDIPDKDATRIAYMLGPDAQQTMPENSAQAAAVDVVGDNIMKLDPLDVGDSGKNTSFEQMALWDPDIVIFSSKRAFKNLPKQDRWKAVTAVKNDACYAVPTAPYNWLSSPAGPNQLLGLCWLSCICYPEIEGLDLEDIVTRHFQVLYGYDLGADQLADLVGTELTERMASKKRAAEDESAAQASNTGSENSAETGRGAAGSSNTANSKDSAKD